jgi:hypothetical protein
LIWAVLVYPSFSEQITITYLVDTKNQRTLSVLKSLYPVLPNNAHLYFFPRPATALFDSGKGSAVRLLYNNAKLTVTVVETESALAKVVAGVPTDAVWEKDTLKTRFDRDTQVLFLFRYSESTGELEDVTARAQLSAMSDFVLSEQPADARRTLRDAIVKLYGKASIIIVSYNGLDLIRNCVTSILERTVYPNYEVIIVDNNSVAEVKAYLIELQRTEPLVRVVLNDTNKGFAAANNIGLRQAQSSDFVILLNNDTIVPRGWLCRCRDFVLDFFQSWRRCDLTRRRFCAIFSYRFDRGESH